MAGPKNQFQDDKRYLVSGAVLNQLARDIATAQVLPGSGVRTRKIPGTGTQLIFTPPSQSPLWSLEVVDPASGTVKIVNPGIVKRTAALDDSGIVSISGLNSTHTAASGSLLVIEILPSLDMTLKVIPPWAGWPMPIDSIEDGDPVVWLMDKAYHVLWDFVDDTDDPDAIAIGSFYAERRSPSTHLQVFITDMEDSDGHIIADAVELLPAMGARRSS